MRFFQNWLDTWRFRQMERFADRRHRLGWDGEKAATQYLKQQGMKLLVPRYRCRHGEVDLVMRDGDTLVFVEVKTRKSEEFGDPSEAVTFEKQKHVSKVALDYLRRLRNPEIPVRFDIVEVVVEENGAKCHHIPNAFPLSEPYLY